MGRVEGRVTEDHVLLGVGARRFRVFAGGLIGACFLLVASLALAFSCSSQASLGGTTTSRPLLNTGVIALGASGWEVSSSVTTSATGSTISTPGYVTTHWLHVTSDSAGAPGTELEALLQNGACANVFYSNNMEKCFGKQASSIGPVTEKRFAVPWWYRTNFTAGLGRGQAAQLVINGIVGQADVWVNGHEVATQSQVTGDFTKDTFNVTPLLRKGANSLALEVFPNDPSTMFTLDDVDWSQLPPDNNTGIQFPIQLAVSGPLGVSNGHVSEQNSANLSTSGLTIGANVTNYSPQSQVALVSATVTPPGGGHPIDVQQTVIVAGQQTAAFSFTPSSFHALTIEHPAVWWPYQMGSQPLYRLTVAVSQAGSGARVTPDSTTSETFGIRTITSSLVGPSPLAPEGVRNFSVNGRPFVFRGGGWSENLFLDYSAQDTANQIALIKSMGLNGVRLEGHDMPENFYEQMDQAGILVYAGFQCCEDTWAPPSASDITASDYQQMYEASLNIGERLRNHPSVMAYSWSDNPPYPEQEKVSLQGFSEADFQDPIISSAAEASSPILGASGEKEGPYDWVPPAYWYDTSHSNPTGDYDVGGSWGFDSEESAGDTIPTLSSIRRFMSPKEQEELWKNPSYNQYHTNYETGVGNYQFGTLFNMDKALSARYGQWSGIAQYVEEAQVQNYEDVRSQFEAFIDHSTHQPTPATGTDYWQVNKGWPSLLWDLYNNDYDEPGSYFGAQEANRSIHVLYAYDTGSVSVDNLTGAEQSGLTVISKVSALNGSILDDQVVHGVSVSSQGILSAVITPKVPADTVPPQPARVYFIELLLERNEQVIDRNVYWLSTQQDVVNWPATEENTTAVMAQYANLQALQDLLPARVSINATSARTATGTTTTQLTITNTSKGSSVAFFLRADIVRGSGNAPAQGDSDVLPVTWSSNDVTLWPGETEKLTATYRTSELKGLQPVVAISGWNVKSFSIAVR